MQQQENQIDAIDVKADLFFARALKVAATNNFDYAIEMYLEGLLCTPDSVEKGHKKLRELALARQTKGGHKPSMMDKMKRSRAKEPLEQMLNAEYLFAKDPHHLAYAETLLKAAVDGDFRKTVKWIADLLFTANNTAEKPSLSTYELLKDSYADIGNYDRAISACQQALKIKPHDPDLSDDLKRLSTEMTVSKGKYDQAGDFTDSIKDRDAQQLQQAQDSIVKTQDYRVITIENARQQLASNPDLPKNIFHLAKALADMQTDDAESEAIELLKNTYTKTKDFSFEQLAGQIRIGQFKRKLRDAKIALQADPQNSRVKAAADQILDDSRKFELEFRHLCTQNYPTDLPAKYEYALCLVRCERYDEAIPLLQQAQKDPRHKIAAMDKIGLCFFRKGWFADAIDTFKKAVDSLEIRDSEVAKELRYNLARSYESLDEPEKALEVYRKIAQLDFAYKDIHQRIERLRKPKTEPPAQ